MKWEAFKFIGTLYDVSQEEIRKMLKDARKELEQLEQIKVTK
jgi:hypothetical protein